jgi:pimeloyl-ACP methyl ester carboxylesterase
MKGVGDAQMNIRSQQVAAHFRTLFVMVLLAFGFLSEMATAPSFAAASGAGVDQTSFVSIGGIDQWISIKGENRDNPVLLVVHGGPGESQWPVADKYVPWEKAFTVVLWDQRGAGHTYGRYGAKVPNFTLARIARDGIEVAEYLCRTLEKKKIVVLGHSWGTIVATEMVQLRPELFAAYVGTGQVASWNATMNMQFDLALARARNDGDAAAIKQLETTGRPDPGDAEQAFSVNIWPAMAPTDKTWIQALRAQAPELKAKYPQDFQNFEDGFKFSAMHALPYQMKVDLPRTASKFDTAFFVIQGQHDVITPTKAAVAYFHEVTAPKKKLILIPDAGHFALMTATDAFLSALIDDIRPVAIERGG